MLWWEGVPSVVRHELWRRTLLADENLSAEQRSLAYAHAVGAAQMVDSEAAERRLVRELGGSADGTPPAFSLPPEFNLYTAPESPMRQALLELMIALTILVLVAMNVSMATRTGSQAARSGAFYQTLNMNSVYCWESRTCFLYTAHTQEEAEEQG